MSYVLKGCPRCGGDIEKAWGDHPHCLQCGYVDYKEKEVMIG